MEKIKWISSLDHCCGDTDVVTNMMLLLWFLASSRYDFCNSIDQFLWNFLQSATGPTLYSGRRTGTEEFSASRLDRIGAHGLSSRSSLTRDMRNDEDEFDMDFFVLW